MKKLFLLTVLTCLIAACVPQQGMAQSKKRKKRKKPSTTQIDEYFDERDNLWVHMWYGAQIGQITFINSQFAVAASPMAAYKFTDKLSAGLITKFSYSYQRLRGLPGVSSYQTLDLSIGPIARYRVIPVLFLHAEYELTRFEHLPTDNFGNPQLIIEEGKILTDYTVQPYLYVGLGYQSRGSVWGYEISLQYNLLDSATHFRIPWDIRFGLNYNF